MEINRRKKEDARWRMVSTAIPEDIEEKTRDTTGFLMKKKKKKKNVIHLMAEIDDVVFQTGVRAEIFVVSAVGTAARRVVDVLAVQLAGQSVGTGRHDASFARTGEKFKHPSEATSTSTMATIARERKLCVYKIFS